MMDFEDIPDNCFISHAYEDKVALDLFLKLLPERIKPTIFNPITVTADEMVSSKLIQKLRNCDALIYLEGGRSDKSFWVAFELNYALLLKKQVFSYNISSGSLNREKSLPHNPPVYASYKRGIYTRPVEPILEFLRNERYFDLFQDTDISYGEKWKENINNGLKKKLDLGGYMILFWTGSIELSEWVKKEIEIVKNHPLAFSHTIVAILNEGGFTRLEEAAPQFIRSGQVIKLYKKKPGRYYKKNVFPEWLDQNRLDDLVVLLHWLVIRNNSNNFSLERFPDLPAKPPDKFPTLIRPGE